jgi:hypothetical protein
MQPGDFRVEAIDVNANGDVYCYLRWARFPVAGRRIRSLEERQSTRIHALDVTLVRTSVQRCEVSESSQATCSFLLLPCKGLCADTH